MQPWVKTKKLIFLIILLLICLALAVFYIKSKKEIPSIAPSLSYQYKADTSESVYTLMQKLHGENKLIFTEKNYSGLGTFIESINNIKNNGEQNWIYYVNDQKANIGVSNYQLKAGDIVTWKYESR